MLKSHNKNMEKQRPKVGLGVAVVKEGKVLLGQRKNSHGAGDWCFPGGHLEFGESWEQCARRETKEETGIEIKNVRFWTATNDIYEKENKHYVTIFMLADYDSGQARVMEPDKSEAWEWFEWDALPKDLFFSTRNLVEKGHKPF